MRGVENGSSFSIGYKCQLNSNTLMSRSFSDNNSTDSTEQRQNPVLTKEGSLRALNYILDIAKGRKPCVVFVLDEKTGHIKEVSGKFTKEIEVQYRSRT